MMSRSDSKLLRAFLENVARLERFFKMSNLAFKYTLTIREASAYTGLGTDKIRDAIVLGELEAYKPLTKQKTGEKGGKTILIKRTVLEKYIDKYPLGVPKVAA